MQTREFKIDDHLMIHDWAVTDTHYILFANRVKLNPIGKHALTFVTTYKSFTPRIIHTFMNNTCTRYKESDMDM